VRDGGFFLCAKKVGMLKGLPEAVIHRCVQRKIGEKLSEYHQEVRIGSFFFGLSGDWSHVQNEEELM
jgi:hypothetical protein